MKNSTAIFWIFFTLLAMKMVFGKESTDGNKVMLSSAEDIPNFGTISASKSHSCVIMPSDGQIHCFGRLSEVDGNKESENLFLPIPTKLYGNDRTINDTPSYLQGKRFTALTTSFSITFHYDSSNL